MGKKKLIRFKELETFEHVIEPTMEEVFNKKHSLAGKWRKEVFKNDHPIVLELGCGKGEYSVGMARKYPEKNFLGVDIKGARIWYGAKDALDNGMKNVAFLRTRIDFITSFFEPGEVDEIWITFPDPQPQRNRRKKRLTSRLFIDRYREFLKPGGIVHLKTDSAFLYEFTCDEIKENNYGLIESSDDLYGNNFEEYSQDIREILGIKTHYEGIFTEKGHKITYLKFTIN